MASEASHGAAGLVQQNASGLVPVTMENGHMMTYVGIT